MRRNGRSSALGPENLALKKCRIIEPEVHMEQQPPPLTDKALQTILLAEARARGEDISWAPEELQAGASALVEVCEMLHDDGPDLTPEESRAFLRSIRRRRR